MRICVYGAASATIDKKYITHTEEMGQILAKRGHSLVFGGGKNGLMGAAARGFKKENAHIIGVIPKFFLNETVEVVYEACDELITPGTMRERKQLLEDHADAFIVVPGGIGTYEEFFEVLTLKQLCQHKKPIAVYNIEGFYDDMERAMTSAINKEFIKDSCRELYFVSDNLEEIINYIENPVESNHTTQHYKNG